MPFGGFPGKRRVDEITWVVFDRGEISLAALVIIRETAEDARRELATGFVIEPVAQHVDEDNILPIGDLKPGGARLIEHVAVWQPSQIGVVVLAADRARLGDTCAVFAGEVAWVGRECGYAVSVAHGVIPHVIAEQRHGGVHFR